ncbi:MAG: ferrous iron transport protein A [Pseudanabaenales cyanobacterium]|nr:ferrous iron transport protein A [Pseudanabaenales cyanobacterium]
MFDDFTVSGSPLKLLKIGEHGVVARLTQAADTATVQALQKMGLVPGAPITLEQRFPRFVIKTGTNRLALSEKMIQAIYVRIKGRVRV